MTALRQEEQTFDRTLERGMAMLDRIVEEARKRSDRTIGGEEAFTLHDTFGFPVELTREIAGEHGVAVDAIAFDRLMEEQRARARRDAASKREVTALADLPAIKSAFTGYDEGLETRGTTCWRFCATASPSIRCARANEGTLVLDRTSFYAERGGQIGDRGTIDARRRRASTFAIRSTWVKRSRTHGVLAQGETRRRRYACAPACSSRGGGRFGRHHTSAHLLQRALKDVLGDEVNQAGSVGRRSTACASIFAGPAARLTPEQKRAVAHRVNEMIRDDSHLVTRVLPIEEAKQTGAIWMAGEKYGDDDSRRAGRSVDRVLRRHAFALHRRARDVRHALRIVDRQRHSPHRIVRLGGGRGVRRAPKRSGRRALLDARNVARGVARARRANAARRQRSADVRSASSRRASPQADAEAYVERAERSGDRAFVGAVVHEANAEALRHLAIAIRNRFRSGVVALAGVDNGSVSLLVSASDDLVRGGVHAGNLVKLAAPLVAGKGGGQAAQAQGGGSDPSGAEAAVRAIRDAVLN